MKVLNYTLITLCLSSAIAYGVTPSQMGVECGQALDRIPWAAVNEDKRETKGLELARDAFILCLSRYLRIQTVSPKGDEHLAVEFLHEAIKVLGWPQKRFETASQVKGQEGEVRANLIATLPATNSKSYAWENLPAQRSVLLNHHSDVVGVVPEQWESPDLPFSGRIAPSKDHPNRQYIWGRGALDMKGIGILQLVSMVLVERMRWPRADVVATRVSEVFRAEKIVRPSREPV